MKVIHDEEVLPGQLFSMGVTTGVLIVPDMDPDKLNGIDYDVPSVPGYQDGEIVTIYFNVDGETNYRHYRVDDEMRPFVRDKMNNLGVLPPDAVQQEIDG